MLKKIYNKLFLKKREGQAKIKEKKIFCIGRNKTGTTSIKKAFEELGYLTGDQRKAELLAEDYFNDKFEEIINYCSTAEVFQDVPFSWPETYKYLDKAFPGSKFILTVRDSDEQWYNSMVNFHSKGFGNGKIPTWEDLKKADYVHKGWSFNNRQKVYNLSLNESPYDRKKLIEHYNLHNEGVINYFKNRPSDLLVINLSKKEAYKKFCNFINEDCLKSDFPWENKTIEIQVK